MHLPPMQQHYHNQAHEVAHAESNRKGESQPHAGLHDGAHEQNGISGSNPNGDHLPTDASPEKHAQAL